MGLASAPLCRLLNLPEGATKNLTAVWGLGGRHESSTNHRNAMWATEGKRGTAHYTGVLRPRLSGVQSLPGTRLKLPVAYMAFICIKSSNPVSFTTLSFPFLQCWGWRLLAHVRWTLYHWAIYILSSWGLEAGYYYVSQANFELTILLPQSPESWYMLKTSTLGCLVSLLFTLKIHFSLPVTTQGLKSNKELVTSAPDCTGTSSDSAAMGLTFYDETR